jgi:hypothetical protein
MMRNTVLGGTSEIKGTGLRPPEQEPGLSFIWGNVTFCSDELRESDSMSTAQWKPITAAR